MAEHQHSGIFSDSECLSMDTMERYAKDQISDAERQVVEKHLVDCDLCSDALEGLILAGFSPDINDRIASLNERITTETRESRGGFWKKEYTSYAAAIVGLMVVSGLLLNFFKTSDITNQEFISQDIVLESPKVEPAIPLSGEGNNVAEKTVENKDAVETTLAPMDDVTDGIGALDKEQDAGVSNGQATLKDSEGLNASKWGDHQSKNPLSQSGSEGNQIQGGASFKTVDTDREPMATGEGEEEDNRRYSGSAGYRSEGKEEKKAQLDGKLYQNGLERADFANTTDKDDFSLGDGRSTEAAPVEEIVLLPEETMEDIETSTREITEAEKAFRQSDKTISLEASGKKEAAAKAMAKNEETTVLKADAEVSIESSKSDSNRQKSKAKLQKAPSYESSSNKKRKTTSKGIDISEKMKERDQEKQSEYNDPYTLGNVVVADKLEAELEPKVSQTFSTVPQTLSTKSTTAAPAAAEPASDISTFVLDEIVDEDDQEPMFQGGELNLKTYLQDNVVYPDSAQKLGIQCKVNVTFTVNVDSTISDATVAKPVGGGCDEEALRVVNKMPKWVPAQLKGKRVARKYSLEIDFESIKD